MSSEESIVVSAPSVDEAISLGLIKLTALRDEVSIEVLDEGSRGFLGIGTREAQVRVTKLSEEELQAAESIPETEESDGVRESSTQIPSPGTPPDGSRATAENDAESKSVATTRAVEGSEKAARRPKKPSRPKPEAQAEPKETNRPERTKPSASKSTMPDVVGGVKRTELESITREVATELLQDLDVDVTLEWLQEDRPTLWIAVDGKDASALVGSRARTLHSLQYLFRALIYHRMDGDYNLVVDANSYRKRRRQSLENLARREAKKAIETGKTVRLRSMPAHERRIIHITLRDDERVTTESVGRGRSRSVTIIPQHVESFS